MTYLTTDDVATKLHLSNDTVRRMCSQKKLTATKVGRQWLVSEEDLAGFMAKHRGKKTPPVRVDRVKRGRRKVA